MVSGFVRKEERGFKILTSPRRRPGPRVKFAPRSRSGPGLRRGDGFPVTHANPPRRGLNFLHFQIGSPNIAGIVRARMPR